MCSKTFVCGCTDVVRWTAGGRARSFRSFACGKQMQKIDTGAREVAAESRSAVKQCGEGAYD